MARIRIRTLIATLFVAAGVVIAAAVTRDRCTFIAGRDLLTVSLDQLGRGEARTFCYRDDAGSKIRFVLARGADGRVRSVFDACRQCYVYHKGYAVSGGDLVCRVCGNRYPIDRMTSGKASCVPVPLAHREESGAVRIKTADLKAGRGLF
jgi:uncharacterized membrane protein